MVVWGYNTTAVSGLSTMILTMILRSLSLMVVQRLRHRYGSMVDRTLKFKNTNGSTTDYSISNAGNTGNMTEAMWIVCLAILQMQIQSLKL